MDNIITIYMPDQGQIYGKTNDLSEVRNIKRGRKSRISFEIDVQGKGWFDFNLQEWVDRGETIVGYENYEEALKIASVLRLKSLQVEVVSLKERYKEVTKEIGQLSKRVVNKGK